MRPRTSARIPRHVRARATNCKTRTVLPPAGSLRPSPRPSNLLPLLDGLVRSCPSPTPCHLEHTPMPSPFGPFNAVRLGESQQRWLHYPSASSCATWWNSCVSFFLPKQPQLLVGAARWSRGRTSSRVLPKGLWPVGTWSVVPALPLAFHELTSAFCGQAPLARSMSRQQHPGSRREQFSPSHGVAAFRARGSHLGPASTSSTLSRLRQLLRRKEVI